MASMMPDLSIEYKQDAVIVAFQKEKLLEESEINAVQESIMLIVEQSGAINLILDFGKVSFLSSAVLGLLLRISRRIYENQGTLKLCSINPKIYEIFKITRLNQIFDIYPDVESALTESTDIE